MKKLFSGVVLLVLAMVLAVPVFAGSMMGGDGQMQHMQKMKKMSGPGMMNCPMTAEKMQQMQAEMEKMKTLRQQMLASGNQPEVGKKLAQEHLAAMEKCLKMLPAPGRMGGCCGAGGRNCGMMNHGGQQGMMKKCQCSCRMVMQEMLTSMKAQMKMME